MAMKNATANLKFGDSIRARVDDVLDQVEVLIVFQDGTLIRVANESGRRLKKGDPVTLLVRAVSPLRFQIMEERAEQRRKGHIDLIT
jgi:hypothetical protein